MSFIQEPSTIFFEKTKLSNLVFEGMLVPPGFDFNQDNIYKGYGVNKFGYRCDELKKVHDGIHILFSGDSVTFGEGMPVCDNVWSKKVHTTYSNLKKTSGYYNLAIPGTGIQSQISNMFRYFENYGNPDLLFFCISDYRRGYISKPNDDTIYDGIYNYDENLTIMKKINYEYYMMLEQYCRSNKIKLMSWTWDFEKQDQSKSSQQITTQEIFSGFKFSTFYRIDTKEFNDLMLEYAKENTKEDFLLRGSDNEHPGKAFHDAMAQFVLKRCYI